MSTSTVNKGNSFLTAYLEATKKLVQTLIIKSEISAFLLNESIKSKYGNAYVEPSMPETWKYYLNLSGQPHFTDVYMNVISLDTLETIQFTPANLRIHTATAEAYQFGTRYFYSLLRKYPQQEAYIRGVLNPVDIQTAIAAEDGSILGYDGSLVEEQEHTLMEDLETYIKGYLTRWTNKNYQTTDAYYSAMLYSVLAIHCFNRILNLRQARCHTNEAHSFHIREYLASHCGLDRYMPYLNLYQKLYLYRNIRYLEHHNGSVEQFNELVQNLLSIRNVPLSEYTVNQISQFDDDKYTVSLAKRRSVGTRRNLDSTEYFELPYLQSKFEQTDPGNLLYLLTHAGLEEKRFMVSNSSVVQTKVLESTMVDYTGAVVDPLVDILIRQWAYMSHNDLYPVSIYFTDPMTGEYRSLSSQDAFTYFNYLSLASVGVEVEKVPRFTNVKFRKHPKPSLDELCSVIPKGFEDLVTVAQSIWSRQPNLTVCQSVGNFNTLCQKLYDESMYHWYLTSSISDMNRLAIVRQMVLKLYGMEWMDRGNGELMNHWLKDRVLPSYQEISTQADEVRSRILRAATGYTVESTKQLKYIQKNLLQLFGQLSSYTIKFLSEVNESAIVPLGWRAIRLGNIQESSRDTPVVHNGVRVLEVSASVKSSVVVKNPVEPTVAISAPVTLESVKVPNGVTISNGTHVKQFKPVYAPAIRYNASYPGYDPAISSRATYIGAEFFESLSEEQRRKIKSF